MIKQKYFAISSFFLILFVLLIPRVCAQPAALPKENAAEMRSQFVEYGKVFLGKPYKAGGIGPDSFDCSGFVYASAKGSIGIDLPRTSRALYSYTSRIELSDLQAGDLVFFKTTSSGTISHVGIWLGNDEFIHSASDGPRTGIIITNLKTDKYWNKCYAGAGKFLPSVSKEVKNESASSVKIDDADSGSSPKNLQKSEKSDGELELVTPDMLASKNQDSFLSKIVLDASLGIDWNFFTSNSVKLNYRGADSMIHARYNGENFRPGVGAYIRYDSDTKVMQFPVVLTLTLGDYTRIFMGPVITAGTPEYDGEEIKSSFFPGIMGVAWNTPSLKVGKCGISIFQDIHYTVFNKMDGTALRARNSVTSGLVFSSGIRVSLPISNIL